MMKINLSKKRVSLLAVMASILLSSCAQEAMKKEVKQIPYEANWSSLRKHNTPQWLEDAKFGIYSHWGAQSVVLESGNPDMPHAEAIEKWKGEKFSAKEWVDLFERAGAQFAGPVAWHVNGMLNWDSKITDWNSVKKGPKVDIFGSLASEIRKRDMKLIASFHSSTLWGPISSTDTTYVSPKHENVVTGTDPTIYGKEGRFRTEYLQGWLERMTEAMELYQPDIVWTDVGFGGTLQLEKQKVLVDGKIVDTGKAVHMSGIREDIQQAYLSRYFNKAQEWGKEVGFIYKSYDIPPGIAMRDIENGNLNGLQFDPWMADINMQQHMVWPTVWFYNPKNKLKDANMLIDMLADITSKNGRILLNVPPKADGSFSEEVKKELYAMGDWLKLNGEAIYGTAPWVIYGEGPAEVINPGHHGQGKNQGNEIPKYTEKDIRFTEKGDALYAICLDWPTDKLHIKSLGFQGKLYPGQIKNISLIGSNDKIEWEQTEGALIVTFPKEKPCDFAYCLKMERRKIVEK
ncbi:hypothetical protein BZG02_02735 [Labilibaculum filiforme]|uniref:alpha-L-fucosidase n=1 Tax=Labilibaculum filiforme TaxID=1940526 RepID=A0A2N3I3A7_9BACT|nr:alpha-L-fucosidase [Labilibaculum filiforme]PKQ64791.1 hypothetical protein BZG02_02735 [Labilibaculum filiforme]